MLSVVNEHPRDSHITFREHDHVYTLKNCSKRPVSVTTLIHNYFPKFDADKVITKMMRSSNWQNSKYFDMSRDEIKKLWKKNGIEASTLGTEMHQSIEDYINYKYECENGTPEPQSFPKTKEFGYFLNFWKELRATHPYLKPYRTEWIVYDEDVMVSGSIDMVMIDERDGGLVILDWKRSKQIKTENNFSNGFIPFEKYHDCNYNHYSLQLNFYRQILERKYDQKIKLMMFIVFHPDNSDYICHKVAHIDLDNVWDDLN